MIQAVIHDIPLVFETVPEVFSPDRIDAGTLAMLSVVRFDPGDKVLDLGCGYGVVGILAARLLGPGQVYMLDNDPRAIALAGANIVLNRCRGVSLALSDGFRSFAETGFTVILCNPPYHVDFSVPKHFIEKGFNRLAIGGRMFMVTKRRLWYQNKFKSIFGGSRVNEVDGYLVFEATRRRQAYASVEADDRT
jgi:16S rRNA (guanine1207-N2)-methyltransferase